MSTVPPLSPEPLTALPRTFGEVVRRDRGPVQAIDASRVAGVSRSFWSDVEHNRRIPSRIVASKMCGAVVGNWNDWLMAWARERLDGSFDDLLAALDGAAIDRFPRLFDNDRDLLRSLLEWCADHGIGPVPIRGDIEDVVNDYLDDQLVAAAEQASDD